MLHSNCPVISLPEWAQSKQYQPQVFVCLYYSHACVASQVQQQQLAGLAKCLITVYHWHISLSRTRGKLWHFPEKHKSSSSVHLTPLKRLERQQEKRLRDTDCQRQQSPGESLCSSSMLCVTISFQTLILLLVVNRRDWPQIHWNSWKMSLIRLCFSSSGSGKYHWKGRRLTLSVQFSNWSRVDQWFGGLLTDVSLSL